MINREEFIKRVAIFNALGASEDRIEPRHMEYAERVWKNNEDAARRYIWEIVSGLISNPAGVILTEIRYEAERSIELGEAWGQSRLTWLVRKTLGIEEYDSDEMSRL